VHGGRHKNKQNLTLASSKSAVLIMEFGGTKLEGKNIISRTKTTATLTSTSHVSIFEAPMKMESTLASIPSKT
jgi:hypothetical protein